MTDAEAAKRIKADRIDILVELKGYSKGARTGISARRPAPVQVSFVGFPGAMGASFIDYLIADPFVVPMDRQPFYSEKIVHLPDCYQPNDTKRLISNITLTRAECGLELRFLLIQQHLQDHALVFRYLDASIDGNSGERALALGRE